jgi:hypothetical protein
MKNHNIDIIIPLGKSPNKHIELMYALRSIEKFAIGYRNIYLIGEKPNFINYKNVIHVPFKRTSSIEYKSKNIFEKIKYMSLKFNISENFLFMNDDHFFCDEKDIIDYPYFYKGPLENSYLNNDNFYKYTVKNTLDFLSKEHEYSQIKNYDIHTPIIYSREKILALSDILGKFPIHGYCIKTMYCYLVGDLKEDFLIPDLKIKKATDKEKFLADIENRHIFSCGDSAWQTKFKIYMNRLYQQKSKFEL